MTVLSVSAIDARSGRTSLGVKRPFSAKYSVLGLRKVRL